MTSFLVLNGPNLNLLGTRQPEVYGTTTLSDIVEDCVAYGTEIGVSISCMQSNHEGKLVDAIHAAKGTFAGIILNAGGLPLGNRRIIGVFEVIPITNMVRD